MSHIVLLSATSERVANAMSFQPDTEAQYDYTCADDAAACRHSACLHMQWLKLMCLQALICLSMTDLDRQALGLFHLDTHNCSRSEQENYCDMVRFCMYACQH